MDFEDKNKLEEYGSIFPVRFLIAKEVHVPEEEELDDNPYHIPSGKGRCLDCERHEHLAKLHDILGGGWCKNLDENIIKLRDALIWVLENTDYPVGE